MQDGTGTPPETTTASTVKNDNGTTTVPATDNRSAEAEQAKREAEQAKMRANQLENELAKIRQAQSEAERKRLEEKEEFKSLYEQAKAQLDETRERQEAQDQAKAVEVATEVVFKEYPDNVVELAKTAGLSLADDSEASVTILKGKLDAFKAKLGGGSASTSSNNNRQDQGASIDRGELVKRNADGVSPMAMAGAKGDLSVVRSYIRAIPAIERMKQMAKGQA